jgi:hypothetical protein
MSLNFNNFEERIISELRTSGLIERFSLNEIMKTQSLEHIIKIFENHSEIFFDKNGVYYFEGNGVKVYCSEMKTSVSDEGERLSSKLPEIGFDIDQKRQCKKGR